MIINPAQNRLLHALLNELKLTAYKADYVIDVTNGRTAHSSELNVMEAQTLITKLQQLVNDKKNEGKGEEAAADQKQLEEKKQSMRRAIISKFREMGCNTDEGKADMNTIHAIVAAHWKTPLNGLSIKEMQRIIPILERKWLPWYYKNRKTNANFSLKTTKTTPEA